MSFRVGPWSAAATAALLLGFQLALQTHLSRVDSQTADEAVHLSAGYSYWEWRSLSLNPEHPPLVKLLAAASVRFLHPKFPAIEHRERLDDFFYDSWFENRALGEAFLYKAGNDADRLLWFGRLPATLLTLLLGASIFLVGARFFGPLGGLLGTALYVFDPTIAAHGHLITTDVAVSLGGVAVLAATWRFAHEPHVANAILLGLACGLAAIAKFTAIIFLPIVLGVVVLRCGALGLVRRAPQLMVAGLVAWFMILAVYGFSLAVPPAVLSVSTVVTTTNHHALAVHPILDRTYSLLRYVAVPRAYFKGLMLMLAHVTGGHDAFLLGARSQYGWWYYFPVVFVTKTPIPVLLLLVIAASVAATRWREPARWYWIAAAGAYIILAMTSRADLGIRHLMPAQAFLFIGIGGLAEDLPTRRGLAMLTAGLLVWLIVGFARSGDQYLAYYNESVGDGGYRIAVDSNLDWGQDLKRIRTYLDRHPEIDRPYVEYPWDGPASLDYYGIRHMSSDAATPNASGVLIISTTMLWDPRWAFIRSLPIEDRVTPGVFVYRLPSVP